MTDEFLTQEIASESATVVETVELPRGEESKDVKIEVKEADIEEIERFEEREEAGESETGLVQEVFDEYLIRPSSLNANNLGSKTRAVILRGIFRAWGAADSDIDEALEDRAGN